MIQISTFNRPEFGCSLQPYTASLDNRSLTISAPDILDGFHSKVALVAFSSGYFGPWTMHGTLHSRGEAHQTQILINEAVQWTHFCCHNALMTAAWFIPADRQDMFLLL